MRGLMTGWVQRGLVLLILMGGQVFGQRGDEIDAPTAARQEPAPKTLADLEAAWRHGVAEMEDRRTVGTSDMDVLEQLLAQREYADSDKLLLERLTSGGVGYYEATHFEDTATEVLIKQLLAAGDRDRLARLLAARCPTSVARYFPIEWYLVACGAQQQVDQPLLALFEAYKRSTNESARRRIDKAIQRGFRWLEIEAARPADRVSQADEWYRENAASHQPNLLYVDTWRGVPGRLDPVPLLVRTDAADQWANAVCFDDCRVPEPKLPPGLAELYADWKQNWQAPKEPTKDTGDFRVLEQLLQQEKYAEQRPLIVKTMIASDGFSRSVVRPMHEFAALTLDVLIYELLRENERTQLVDLLSAKCPSFIGVVPIEWFVARYGHKAGMERPTGVLLEAYERWADKYTRRVLYEALERGFWSMHVEGSDESSTIKVISDWYRRYGDAYVANDGSYPRTFNYGGNPEDDRVPLLIPKAEND